MTGLVFSFALSLTFNHVFIIKKKKNYVLIKKSKNYFVNFDDGG